MIFNLIAIIHTKSGYLVIDNQKIRNYKVQKEILPPKSNNQSGRISEFAIRKNLM
ncbi:MAG: hypothetical protein PWR23_892 [Peptostreptococcaceae bacterium]|jgi:hypothetical protein|nr:hypothetical protein [Peptostreptococcaceae bacterium]